LPFGVLQKTLRCAIRGTPSRWPKAYRLRTIGRAWISGEPVKPVTTEHPSTRKASDENGKHGAVSVF
jgi:hypothetical protein